MICVPVFDKPFSRRPIEVESFALSIRTVQTTNAWTLVRSRFKPFEAADNVLNGSRN